MSDRASPTNGWPWAVTASAGGVLVHCEDSEKIATLLAQIRAVGSDGESVAPDIDGNWARFTPPLSAGSRILLGEQVMYEVPD